MATPTSAADVDVFAENEQEFIIGYGEIIAAAKEDQYSEEALRVGTDPLLIVLLFPFPRRVLRRRHPPC